MGRSIRKQMRYQLAWRPAEATRSAQALALATVGMEPGTREQGGHVPRFRHCDQNFNKSPRNPCGSAGHGKKKAAASARGAAARCEANIERLGILDIRAPVARMCAWEAVMLGGSGRKVDPPTGSPQDGDVGKQGLSNPDQARSHRRRRAPPGWSRSSGMLKPSTVSPCLRVVLPARHLLDRIETPASETPGRGKWFRFNPNSPPGRTAPRPRRAPARSRPAPGPRPRPSPARSRPRPARARPSRPRSGRRSRHRSGSSPRS